MPDLNDLRKQRGDRLAEMEKLAAGDQTAETRTRFDTLEAEVRTIGADIERLERLEAAKRSHAASQAPVPPSAPATDPGAAPADPAQQRSMVPAAVAETPDAGFVVGGFIRSFAMSAYSRRAEGQNPVNVVQAAQQLYGERHPITAAAERSQVLSQNSSGGLTVPPNISYEIIRLFGPATIVRRRAQVVPGNTSYLKGKTGATVGYVGENEQGQVTGVTFGMIDMTERDISAILPISKKLLRHTAFGVEQYCRDELTRAAAEFEDRMFLYGTGTGKQVKGYKHAILKAHQYTAIDKTAPTNAEVRKDLRKLLAAIWTANVPLDANEPAWLMHSIIKMFLEDLYQGDLKAFPTLEGSNPTLLGYPVVTTTQINGPGGDGGEIFFGAHRFAMVGDSVAMSLSVSDQASFRDANGNQVNMWAQGLMAIKLDMSHDFALRYEQAFALLEKVKWGGA